MDFPIFVTEFLAVAYDALLMYPCQLLIYCDHIAVVRYIVSIVKFIILNFYYHCSYLV